MSKSRLCDWYQPRRYDLQSSVILGFCFRGGVSPNQKSSIRVYKRGKQRSKSDRLIAFAGFLQTFRAPELLCLLEREVPGWLHPQPCAVCAIDTQIDHFRGSFWFRYALMRFLFTGQTRRPDFVTSTSRTMTSKKQRW